MQDRRKAHRTIRLTVAEQQLLRIVAHRAGTTVSEWLRSTAITQARLELGLPLGSSETPT